jgi:DNA-binding response OmpR family regulator
MKALVVDDDLALADVLSFTMRRAGFDVIVAHDGQAALDRWEAESPELIILDLNLPRMDGLKVCQQIRSCSSTPIIILSVRGQEDDIIRGLQVGADDYMVKPFSPRQLVARAEAVLRRAKGVPHASAPLQAGDLLLDPAKGTAVRSGCPEARLTRLECRLLEALLINRGQALSWDSLIDWIWGPQGGDRTMLKQLVYRLRRKIEKDPSRPECIITVPGLGYLLEA